MRMKRHQTATHPPLIGRNNTTSEGRRSRSGAEAQEPNATRVNANNDLRIPVVLALSDVLQ